VPVASGQLAQRARQKPTPKSPRIRLRRANVDEPGIRRRRAGRGFAYLEPDGTKVSDDEVLARIHDLRIPPAWQDVWICPYPGGHIQATGIDARGRKQYLYHRRWRERRDQEKFDEMLTFARALPGMREHIERDLEDADDDTLSRERVLACAVRLLDRGFFRIGSEDYAVENDTYGLATMRKEHVTLNGRQIAFDYPAKHGKRRVQSVIDPEVAAVVERLKRRRGGSPELLAYKRGRKWVDVKSADINAYIKEITGQDFSAKDFRTWGATVLAAVALASSAAASGTKTARKRAVTRAIKEVAGHLGNTPAVARASYIDPRVIDRYLDGITILPALELMAADPDDTAIQGDIEAAVLDLIEDYEESEMVAEGADVLEPTAA
jgi:DNA topoisomerase IB